MQCPSCGKTGFVTVGSKRYCSNCGAQLASQQPAAMSDLRRTPGASAPAVSTAASQLHGQQIGSKAGVLDLRAPKPSPPAPVESTPNNVIVPRPRPVRPAEVAPPEIPPAPPPIAPAIAAKHAERLERAAAIPKSQALQKFTKQSDANLEAPPPLLPNAVAAQVEANAKLAEATNIKPQAKELREALADAKPKLNLTSVAAAIAAIAIMGAYIWAQNSPKLAFHSAAGKAGFEATLPNYIPTSYHQNGPVQAQPGQLTINFSSPSINEPLTITQRKTDWDPDSLRENYVSHQTNSFLAVQGQGLTIYLYNNNQASWVNHGVWYSIAGTAHLSRDQVLKIAYSL